MHHYKLIITNDEIYPGTIQFHLAINTKSEHNLFRYQCLHEHKHLIDQHLINGRDQLSMSLHGHKHLIDQRLINGCDQLAINVSPQTQALDRSTPNQWARSAINVLHGHKHATINAKPMSMILSLFIKTGNDNSLVVISMESLYQLMYLRFICYKLTLIDLITIPTL